MNQISFFAQITFFINMTKKKNTRQKIKRKNAKKNSGLAKIATITTKSLSNAFVNFKKKSRT